MSQSGEASDMFVPAGDEHVARLAEIGALRQITDTLNRMGKFMQGMADDQKQFSAKLAEMHTDITVMKLQDEKIAGLKEICADHASRIKAIELVHAGQAGAAKGFNTIREWAPAILALLIGLFTLIKTGALHL